MLFDILLPYCLSIGVPYDTFWGDGFNRRSIDSYTKAYQQKRKLLDEDMWYMGAYVNNAVAVAIDQALNGRKSKSKYLEQPLLHDVDFEPKEEKELTEEQKVEETKRLFKFLERIGKKAEQNKG